MRPFEFFRSGNKVIAVSSFAEKRVRGVAKCDPDDEFSFEYGKELAAARCNKKIASKRLKCAKTKLDRAIASFEAAKEHLEFMTGYYDSSVNEYEEAIKHVEELLSELD